MKLPSPFEKLAGCVWLPRIITKARMLHRGELPQEYAVRFCDPNGVDGQFLSYFHLEKNDILFIAQLSDAAISEWFTKRFSGTEIETWNHLAVNLGRSGFPMAERLSLGLASAYRNVSGLGLETVFDVLEADERGEIT